MQGASSLSKCWLDSLEGQSLKKIAHPELRHLFCFPSFPTIYFAPAGKKQSPKKYEVSVLLLLGLCKKGKVESKCSNNEESLRSCAWHSVLLPWEHRYLVVPAGNVLLHAADSRGRASLTVALVSCLAPEHHPHTHPAKGSPQGDGALPYCLVLPAGWQRSE